MLEREEFSGTSHIDCGFAIDHFVNATAQLRPLRIHPRFEMLERACRIHLYRQHTGGAQGRCKWRRGGDVGPAAAPGTRANLDPSGLLFADVQRRNLHFSTVITPAYRNKRHKALHSCSAKGEAIADPSPAASWLRNVTACAT